MRKLCLLLMALLLLSGCTQASYETMQDEIYDTSAYAQQVSISVPEQASVFAMEKDVDGKYYICDDYSVCTYTVVGGDLQKTILDATGYSEAQINILETCSDNIKRYDAVWVAAGEAEEQIGRISVLDDGNYHYVLTAMYSASLSDSDKDVVDNVFRSFCLIDNA